MRIDRIVLCVLLLCATCSAQRVWRNGNWKHNEAREVSSVATNWIASVGGNKNIADSNNWSNGTPSSGTSPAIFDSNGQSDCTVGMDLSAQTFRVIRKEGYKGKIGTIGNPLHYIPQLASTTEIRLGPESGETHLQHTNDGARIHVLGDGAQAEVYVYSVLGVLLMETGHVTVTAGCELDSLQVLGGRCTVIQTGNAPANVRLVSGDLNMQRDFPALLQLLIAGGTLRYTGSNGMTDASSGIEMTGGQFILDPSEALVNWNLLAYAGVLDFSDSRFDIDFQIGSVFGRDLGVKENQDFDFDGIDLRRQYE